MVTKQRRLDFVRWIWVLIFLQCLCDSYCLIERNGLFPWCRRGFCARQQSVLRNTRSEPNEASLKNPSIDRERKVQNGKPSGRVLLQKVVRPVVSTRIPVEEFLGHLVDFLQTSFEVPDNLPMIYQKEIDVDSLDGAENRIVVALDSPLSPDSGTTRLAIELVGIFNSKTTAMAMVVVRKEGDASFSKLPSMLQNLFLDSESKIVESLDRQLDEFVSRDFESSGPPEAVRDQQEILEDFMVEPRDDMQVIDVDPVRTSDSASSQTPIQQHDTEDFAVKQAKKFAAQRKKKAQVGEDSEMNNSGLDFAVQAAKNAARKRKQNQASDESVKHETKQKAPEGVSDFRSIRPPMLNHGGRRLSTTISTPENYQRRQVSSEKRAQTKPLGQKSVVRPTVKNEKEEILKGTAEALNELKDFDEDISPEELLRRVMTFGEEESQNEEPGAAFATGAFDKAKEILREQRDTLEKRRIESISKQVSSKLLENEISYKEVEDFSTSEELRKMFEAGQRLAENRISLFEERQDASISPTRSSKGKDVDELIASETSVSSYARSLDDDLVELEAQINRSPAELVDRNDKGNPIFDIMTGPETFNPNVDPLTAVNWPGARADQRNIRIPEDLHAARRQAKFAAEVVTSCTAVEQDNGTKVFYWRDREITNDQYDNLLVMAEEGIRIGLIPNPEELKNEGARLQMLLDELVSQPDDRMSDIVDSYRDLLLSENFVSLVRSRMENMAERDMDALRRDDVSLEEKHKQERELLGRIVVNAQLLLKETHALGAKLEAQQLEIIRSICKVAMDPSHATEEEAAIALTDAVRDMRPLFDDAFIAYLKYAVAEEEGRLARSGLLDDPEHNQWLFVLQIVQKGVYAEVSKSIGRYIDHIWYVLRMETAKERFLLLKDIIDSLPSLDVKPFLQVVNNIAASLGECAKGDFDYEIGELTTKILQLRRDTQELLPPERVTSMSKEADAWVKRQREKLVQQQDLTRQRLKAGAETEQFESRLSESPGPRGEFDRLD